MTAVRALAPAACALLLALAGCGDDEDGGAAGEATPTAPAETRERTAPATTEEEPPEAMEEPATETSPSPSPEDEPGGAGDEEPARALALFTARDGRITPRQVRVPPFISIRVELRAADGREYGLAFAEKGLFTTEDFTSTSTTFDGLRPGERLVGRPLGRGNRVTIVASAEPGP